MLARLLAKRDRPNALQAHLTDNQGDSSVGREAEKSVTIDAANRYDELGANPLVSAQEMQALLGSLE